VTPSPGTEGEGVAPSEAAGIVEQNGELVPAEEAAPNP
jgi:hypothetical protein